VLTVITAAPTAPPAPFRGDQTVNHFKLICHFGGFLGFATTVVKPDLLPKKLTERRFP
jgi:hypothetical protein